MDTTMRRCDQIRRDIEKEMRESEKVAKNFNYLVNMLLNARTQEEEDEVMRHLSKMGDELHDELSHYFSEEELERNIFFKK